jgi:hypothetical protein
MDLEAENLTKGVAAPSRPRLIGTLNVSTKPLNTQQSNPLLFWGLSLSLLSSLLLSAKLRYMKNTISIYFPDDKLHWIGKLRKIAKRQERSANYIILKAIEAYLEREGT